MNKELYKRIKGVLVGCAFGDAMGMPTEFILREHIAMAFPEGVNKLSSTTPYELRPNHYLPAGSITDDTINTLLVVKMIIEHKGKVSASTYLDELKKWINSDPKNVTISGPSTMKALKYLEKGLPLEKAGILGTTNGSSMKISPIGIICDYHDLNHLVDTVEQVCIPTHNNSIAIAGASAVAAAVSYTVRGGKDLNELWNLAYKAIELGEKRGFKGTDILLSRRMKSIQKFIETHSFDESIEEIKYFYGTGYSTSETIPAVFAIIQLAEGNPLKTAKICAELGGDTDTYGAIATSICGGMHPDFPLEEVKLIENVNKIDFDLLAKKLFPYVEII